MGCDHKLSARGRRSALFGKTSKQTRVKMVLGLFNSDEWRRLWVVEHGQIGQHLQGAVRGVLCKYRPFKGGILDLEQQPPIREEFRIHMLQSWDTALQDPVD